MSRLISNYQYKRLFQIVGTTLIGIVLFAGIIFAQNRLNYSFKARAQEVLPEQIYMPLVHVNDPWINPVGVETHMYLENKPVLIDRLAGLSPSWIRLNAVSWKDLQSDPGTPIEWPKLADFENNLDILLSMGAKPIVVIDDYPSWATISGNNCGPLAPSYYDDFASFVSAVVSRYKLKVSDWELGNEVDVDASLVDPDSGYGCWGNIADLQYYGGYQYGEMLKVVSPAIRAANPYARIWHGGLLIGVPATTNPALGKQENFFRGVLAAGAAPYFDILPYHAHGLYYGGMRDPYISPLNPWYSWGGGIRGKARFLRAIMQEYGIDKPMMVNEIGVGCLSTESYCDPLPEEFYEYKANMAVRIAVRITNENLMGMIWYTLEGPGWRSAGLLNADKSPQLAYTALQFLKDQTKGAPFIGTVDYNNPALESYAYKLSGNKELHILWALSVEQTPSYNVSVPKASFIQAFNRDGNPIAPIDAGANWGIPVGFSPVYIQRTP